MTVEFTKVRISNEQSLSGLFLNVADFLREQAADDKIFEVYSVSHNIFADSRCVYLRQLTARNEEK